MPDGGPGIAAVRALCALGNTSVDQPSAGFTKAQGFLSDIILNPPSGGTVTGAKVEVYDGASAGGTLLVRLYAASGIGSIILQPRHPQPYSTGLFVVVTEIGAGATLHAEAFVGYQPVRNLP